MYAPSLQLGSPVLLLPLVLNNPCLSPARALWFCRVISAPENSYLPPDGVMVTCGS